MNRDEIKALLLQLQADSAAERGEGPYSFSLLTDSYVDSFLKRNKVSARNIETTPMARFIAEHDWRNALAFIWALLKIFLMVIYDSFCPRLLFNLDSTGVPFNEEEVIVLAPKVLAASSKHISISRPSGNRKRRFYGHLYSLLAASGELGPLLMTIKDSSVREIVSIPAKGFGLTPDSIGYFWVVPGMSKQIFIKYFDEIFIPHATSIRLKEGIPDEIAVIIVDGQQEQVQSLTDEKAVLKAFEEANMHVIKTPASTSALNQPADVVSVAYHSYSHYVSVKVFSHRQGQIEDESCEAPP